MNSLTSEWLSWDAGRHDMVSLLLREDPAHSCAPAACAVLAVMVVGLAWLANLAEGLPSTSFAIAPCWAAFC